MPLFSLFSGKRNTEELERTRREFISQMQALRQDMQKAQQSLVEEIRQLSNSINASHATQLERTQVLVEGVRRSSKSIETLHECIEKLTPPVSQIRLLSDAIKQLQKNVESIPLRISQLLRPVPPTAVYNGKLDESHAGYLIKTREAKDAYQTRAEVFGKAQQEQDKAHRELHDVIKNLPPPVVIEQETGEQETDPMQIPEPEVEGDSPGTA